MLTKIKVFCVYTKKIYKNKSGFFQTEGGGGGGGGGGRVGDPRGVGDGGEWIR